MKRRSADPYRDLDVIDARAPRFNQLVIGSLALTAFLVDWWPLYAILAVQLAPGLTLGRRWCLPASPTSSSSSRSSARDRSRTRGRLASRTCSELCSSAPRRSRTRRVLRRSAGRSGCSSRRSRSLAAVTGLCAGCEAYRLGARLRGIRPRPLDRIDLEELGAQAGDDLVVQFTHPLCTDCRALERRLRGDGRSVVTVDVSQTP